MLGDNYRNRSVISILAPEERRGKRLTEATVPEDARLVGLCGEKVREGREISDIVPTFTEVRDVV